MKAIVAIRALACTYSGRSATDTSQSSLCVSQIPVRKYERKRRLRECDIDPTPQESASGYTPSVDPSRKSSRTACAPHVLCEQFVDVVAPDTESTPSSKCDPSPTETVCMRGSTLRIVTYSLRKASLYM